MPNPATFRCSAAGFSGWWSVIFSDSYLAFIMAIRLHLTIIYRCFPCIIPWGKTFAGRISATLHYLHDRLSSPIAFGSHIITILNSACAVLFVVLHSSIAISELVSPKTRSPALDIILGHNTRHSDSPMRKTQ